jgi:glycosyltransferase involved in cell wall biosynthesis
MKLLIFSPYYPPHIGGLENHSDEFNKYLSQKEMDITVFTPRLPKGSPENEIKYNNVKIIRFPAFEIISGYPLPEFWNVKFWNLFLALFEKKFDIVISRTRFFSTSLLALIYAKIKRDRWIHIEHGSDFVRLSSYFKTFIAKSYDYTFGFLIFRLSDLNISISKAVEAFVNKFDKRETPVIYRGIDFGEIDRVEPNKELKEKYQNKTIISFLGRLYKWKGVENSIMAIKSLPQEIKDKIIFLIIGNGEDYERLKNLIDNDEAITMLGSLKRDDALSILKISDIYIHSSFSGGGLSTSLLEAMYCGCAVIATKNEGADEIIEHRKNGLILQKIGPEELSKNIISLLKDKERMNAFSKKAKEDIKDEFSWIKATAKYLLILNEYAGRNKI